MSCPSTWHCRLLPVARGHLHRATVVVGIVFVFAVVIAFVVFVLLLGSRSPLTAAAEASLQYGVVIDLGSSGSRVFVYVWPPHTGHSRELLSIRQLRDADANPVVLKIEPGISSLASTPHLASDHVLPLLDYAAKHIPRSKHQQTPLYILATAGLRMLSKREQDAILTDLKADVASQYEFLFAPSQVELISGKQEAVYTWVAINYALERFTHNSPDGAMPMDDHSSHNHTQKKSVGIIDIGGASLQIAYEVSSEKSGTNVVHASDIADFSLGCRDSDVDHHYRVFVTTLLGFGGNAARTRYKESLVKADASGALGDPCLPVGMTEETAVGTTNASTSRSSLVVGTGDFDACRRRLAPLLGGAACAAPAPLCSLGGAIMPAARCADVALYGMSELVYSTQDVLALGTAYHYSTFTAAARKYCATPWKRLKARYRAGLYPKASWHRLKYQCFKSAWVTAVLHDALRLPTHSTRLTNARLVNGQPVQWSLGAILFKTRYFPLREIEKIRSSYGHQRWRRHPPAADNRLLFFAILVAVIIAAVVVYRRRNSSRSRRAKMPRVPTMSYFMTEMGQCEEGILIDKASPPSPFSRW